jgi:tape measure domain-containing protein
MDCNPIPKDLASEALSAEALSSLNESSPRLVRAVAEGLGITHGGLRLMAEQGALTSEVLIVAFQKKAQDQQQEDRDRMAEIDAKAAAYGFSHADVLRALDAVGMPEFAAGDMLARVHPGEAIVPQFASGKTKASELFSKVEIVNDGLRRLCFVNGRQIGQVLKLETPRARDMLAGVVEISFLASEIVERQVSSDEFKALDSEVLVNGCSGGSAPAFAPWPEALALGREIIRLNTQIASLLGRWDGDGIPSQRA